MVAAGVNEEVTRLFELLGGVYDPEIPVLSLLDLGVVRNVSVQCGKVNVTITPTYAGCPAITAMRADIESTLAAAGYEQVVVQQKLSPAWSTDWMTERGREKLRDYGIAPPLPSSEHEQGKGIECPQCRGTDVEKISEFGSTACKALYRCRECLEPFDYFKCL